MFTFRLASAARIAVAGVFIGVAGVPLVSACGSAPRAMTAATTSLTKVVATQSVPSAERPGPGS